MDKQEKVADYYAQEHHFKEGIAILRKLAIEAGAEETYKWHAPVYTFNDKNIFWISRFKNHFGLGFFKGVDLKDSDGVLVNAQPGKTQDMRHWKFTSAEDIDNKRVLTYINEAIANAGK